MSKSVCQLNDEGIFVGMSECQPSPLEAGVYLIPGKAIDLEVAPEIPEGKVAKWDFEKEAWEIIDQPKEDEVPEPEEPARVAPAAKGKKAKK